MTATRSRWVLLAVLTSITIINYIDRQTVSILFSAMTKELHFPEQTYATLVTLFLIGYTAMYAIGGWLVDRVGARNGLAAALTWWSVATALTAFVHSVLALEACRVMLALAQPIVFSAGVKACAEIFPSEKRAMATGIFSSGSGVGALIATPVLATLALHNGWRFAMVSPALLGLLIVPVWIIAYNRAPKLVQARGQESNSENWGRMFSNRSAWALVIPRAIGDPLWYFCLFWIPAYLAQARHLDLRQLAIFGWMPFLFADMGSILGGSISDAMIRRGRTPIRSRMTVLVVIAFVAPLGALIGFVSNLWLAVLLMGVIAFASQCWTTTTTALATDIFAKSNVGAIVGMMGTVGGLGGVAFSQITGTTVHHLGFAPAFIFAALLMPLAVSLLTLLLSSRLKTPPETRQIIVKYSSS